MTKRRFNMPGMDKTGPLGTGPIGRGMGPCGGGGRGMARGFRRGGGAGWAVPAVSAKEQKTLLEQRKNWLKTQLEEAEKLLDIIEKPEE
jgi:hypothetical protein